MTTVAQLFSASVNPLEIVEQLATAEDWCFDRSADDEINITVAGNWSDYHVCFNWHEELEGLHLACTFDTKVPAARCDAVTRLMTLINEQLWLGHFDLWRKEGAILYRNGLMLTGGAEANPAQCETMLRLALEASERYYPAFQFVLWAGKDPEAAIEAALLETMGTA